MDSFEDDEKDIVEAIQTNEFLDEFNIPKVQYDRLLNTPNLVETTKDLLDTLLPNGYPLTGEEYISLSEQQRKKIKEDFSFLYVSSLRSPNITSAESRVISTSLHILIWKIQGKSFKETVQLRYNYITHKKEQNELKKKQKAGEISKEVYDEKIGKMTLKFAQAAFTLPNKHTRGVRLFPEGTLISNCDYDRLIYDTYDYLDKVISLSISDPINASLEIYYNETKDLRAKTLQNYIRYGTNSQFEILLLRYGFEYEDYEWLTPCVNSITEDGIDFNEKIHLLSEDQYKQIERYI